MQSFLEIFDIYLLEAVVNGILLGGVLALLALGLNLIFGVIDVTWICYAELVMIGMYGMYYLVHRLRPAVLRSRRRSASCWSRRWARCCTSSSSRRCLSAAPINQLLATGGVLFVLQSFATVAFGIDFRNLGIRLPVLAFGEMHFSYARLLAFGAALIGMVVVYLFMTRTYHRHRDPRHRAGPPDHGADGRRHASASISSPRRSAARWPASRPACWCCSTTCIPSSACRSGRSPS